jgi:8-oxo-dGTP pyrophosphatase MutT (NUDIX family)
MAVWRGQSRMRRRNMSSGESNEQGGLRAALQDYRQRWRDEAGVVDDFVALLEDGERPFARERLAGHFTGAAWLVSADGGRALLTHHRKLDRWLQPGGHADGDSDLRRVALREAGEESGLTGLSIEPDIFDLDRHWIPDYRGIPGHWHYDVRYVVRAGRQESFMVSDESHALAWRDIGSLLQDSSLDESLHRMARKWLARAAAINRHDRRIRP